MKGQSLELAKQCAINLANTDGEAHIIDVVGIGYVAVTRSFELDRKYYHSFPEGRKQYFTFVETIKKTE